MRNILYEANKYEFHREKNSCDKSVFICNKY